jgi:hypothetical protein
VSGRKVSDVRPLYYQCCGAKAARIRIILVEPERQLDPALAAAAPALNLMLDMSGLLKMSQTMTLSFLNNLVLY